jgi:hypothetical protein
MRYIGRSNLGKAKIAGLLWLSFKPPMPEMHPGDEQL